MSDTQKIVKTLDFIAKLSEHISSPMYATAAVLQEQSPIGHLMKFHDSRGTFKYAEDSRVQQLTVATTLLGFSAMYFGGFTVHRSPEVIIAAVGNHLVAVIGEQPEYRDLFAFLALYQMATGTIVTSSQHQEDDSFFYLSTQNPQRLIDFVVVGYPGLRRELRFGSSPVGTKSLTIPKPKGEGIIKIVVKEDPAT